MPESPDARMFEGVLTAAQGGGAFIEVPFSVPDVFGAKGQVRVKGTLDGHEFRGSLAPYGGRHIMGVRKEWRAAIGKGIGETIRVVIEGDTEERTVEVPADLRQALGEVPGATEAFERLSYSHRREYVQWIEEAKKPETRARRVVKTVEAVSGRK